MTATLSPTLLAALLAVDTPTICNALEVVVGSRTAQGFTRKPFVATEPAARLVGYARTATLRAAAPGSMSAEEKERRRLAYYEHVVSGSGPQITVIQDLDSEPGIGAFWGEVNSALHHGLGVAGCLTNGAVRDLDALTPGFPIFAGTVSPSHAWVHIVDIGCEVELHGLPIQDGDLLHADRHGAVVIPPGLVEAIPDAIAFMARKEAVLIEAARQPGFTPAHLREAWARMKTVS
ncbi:MAG: RraA family protein [Alphaproteobacteria bacterium]|nr:RraA family protein [Alphaproteobacteria bacterium]